MVCVLCDRNYVFAYIYQLAFGHLADRLSVFNFCFNIILFALSTFERYTHTDWQQTGFTIIYTFFYNHLFVCRDISWRSIMKPRLLEGLGHLLVFSFCFNAILFAPSTFEHYTHPDWQQTGFTIIYTCILPWPVSTWTPLAPHYPATHTSHHTLPFIMCVFLSVICKPQAKQKQRKVALTPKEWERLAGHRPTQNSVGRSASMKRIGFSRSWTAGNTKM